MDTNTLKYRRTKRTTITLEADVADYIQATMSKKKGLKEKELINKLLRYGMKAEVNQKTTDFKINGFKTQLISDVTAEDVEKMLDEF